MGKPLDVIATDKQVCACCKKFKTCNMYLLQDGRAAWVCVECREGRR